MGDAVKVKGMFIHGAESTRRSSHPRIARSRLSSRATTHQDHLDRAELAPGAAVDVRWSRRAARPVKVRGEVHTGAVPENASGIDDRRVWK